MSDLSPNSQDRRVSFTDKGELKEVQVTDEGLIEKTATGETHRVSASFALDPAAERKLVWKFDLHILPVLAVMYLFNSLDKSNLGNAKTAGLEKTLNLTGDQYNTILSVFFVPYVLTAPFLAVAGKKYGPSRVLPLMMVSPHDLRSPTSLMLVRRVPLAS